MFHLFLVVVFMHIDELFHLEKKKAICVQYLINNKVLYQMGFELNHDNTGAAIWFWCISLTCNTFFC